ncbi:MAG: ribosome maturation factor RimP [Chitinispirillaceae bacterium]
MSSVEQITPVIESKIEELGYELYDVRFFGAGKRSILRITIDRPEGVSIRDCEKVSRELSVLLDEEKFMGDKPYSLEVSSPGIDRPLKTERDFLRVKERNVVLHLAESVEGKKTLRGKVVACGNNKLTVEIENKTVDIPLCDIYSGKEEIRFK